MKVKKICARRCAQCGRTILDTDRGWVEWGNRKIFCSEHCSEKFEDKKYKRGGM